MTLKIKGFYQIYLELICHNTFVIIMWEPVFLGIAVALLGHHPLKAYNKMSCPAEKREQRAVPTACDRLTMTPFNFK